MVQMWEEKKSERRASASVWVGDSQLLRESRKESEWARWRTPPAPSCRCRGACMRRETFYR